ncbi:MAG: hypothetical protein D6718_01910, partial [Acidobacteria bacterium]
MAIGAMHVRALLFRGIDAGRSSRRAQRTPVADRFARLLALLGGAASRGIRGAGRTAAAGGARAAARPVPRGPRADHRTAPDSSPPAALPAAGAAPRRAVGAAGSARPAADLPPETRARNRALPGADPMAAPSPAGDLPDPGRAWPGRAASNQRHGGDPSDAGHSRPGRPVGPPRRSSGRRFLLRASLPNLVRSLAGGRFRPMPTAEPPSGKPSGPAPADASMRFRAFAPPGRPAAFRSGGAPAGSRPSPVLPRSGWGGAGGTAPSGRSGPKAESPGSVEEEGIRTPFHPE